MTKQDGTEVVWLLWVLYKLRIFNCNLLRETPTSATFWSAATHNTFIVTLSSSIPVVFFPHFCFSSSPGWRRSTDGTEVFLQRFHAVRAITARSTRKKEVWVCGIGRNVNLHNHSDSIISTAGVHSICVFFLL